MRIRALFLAMALMVALAAPGEMAGEKGDSPSPLTKTRTTQPKNTYVVKSGDTLWDIARNQGISVAALMAANPMQDPSSLAVGQELRLPVGNETAVDISLRYEVQAGDTLWDIARGFGVSPTNVIAANRLTDPGKLTVGQKLVIPGVAPGVQMKRPKAPAHCTRPDAGGALACCLRRGNHNPDGLCPRPYRNGSGGCPGRC